MPTYKYLNDTGLERALSKLKTYIDSQSGGDSDVKGAIIFDTTTLSVGNVVRARSITNPFHIYEQTVLESGPQIVMRVEPFEQWKICLLEYGVPTIKIETESTTALSVSVTVQGTNKSKHTVNSTDTAYSVSCISIVWNDDRSAWVMTAAADCTFNSNSYSNGDEIDVWGEDDVVELTVIGELQESVEIGGVYKTVDYGQTLFINVLDKSTFRGIKGILNAGQATTQIQVGDEVHTLLEGADWVMQVADVSATRVTLASKYLWKASTYSNAAKTYYSASSPIHDEITSFLAKLPQADQDCIETITKPQHTPVYQNSSWSTYSDKIWLPNTWEVLGDRGSIGNYYGTSPLPLTQFPLFTTQANRVKTLASGGTAYPWWTCDGNATSYGGESYQGINDLGNSAGYGRTVSNYLLPCCAIEADS